jgi:single-strand DNA-binding protein
LETGASCAQYLKKGSPVYVEGRLATRSWTDDDGKKRWITEIHARDIQFLGNGGRPGQAPEPDDNDIPF